MILYLYNTLTRQKEEFKPMGEVVKIYTCGPTVYNFAHIGNFRSYVFMDTLRRVLKYNGYKLKHVMNITDVGHLESDADEGEDKIVKAAKKENKNPYEIAEFYTKVFLKDLERLNIEKPEIICKATDHIKEMCEYVEKIVKNGYGYETSKGIYFDISKLDKYPVLSSRKVDEQIAGARVEVDTEKKNPEDFALWIKAPSSHIMKWESPWGLCYPGWHIECSAMSTKYLGQEFDIHTGGIDHIPTHHENEIAQSKGNCGKIPAKIWMHCNFLQVDGGKMSKSLGNIYTIDELIQRRYNPLAYKLFCYTSHYRNNLNFTFEGLDSAKRSLVRLRSGYQKHLKGNEEIAPDILENYERRFHEAINDDLNMPKAMGVIWELIKFDKYSKQIADLLLKFDEVLGIRIDQKRVHREQIPEEIEELAKKREIARNEKNWKLSDELRDIIKEKGYIIKDTKEGYTIEKI